jgi:hypothetical protein
VSYDREPKAYGEADEYYDQLFKDVFDIVSSVVEAKKEDPNTTSDLPFDMVRVIGHDERVALVRELEMYSKAALDEASNVGQRQGGIMLQQMLGLIAPQMLLSFCAGYRHAVQEIELPPGELDAPQST